MKRNNLKYNEIKNISFDEFAYNVNSNFKILAENFNKLSRFVMESKKFEKFVWISILIFYCYIGLHVGLWIGSLL